LALTPGINRNSHIAHTGVFSNRYFAIASPQRIVIHGGALCAVAILNPEFLFIIYQRSYWVVCILSRECQIFLMIGKNMNANEFKAICATISFLTGPQLIELADQVIGLVSREFVEILIDLANKAFDVAPQDSRDRSSSQVH
jgi:hypothetical protein